jgi:hypothetical protein
MLHKDYYNKGSVETEITGRESQGACHQDELICKVTLTLTLTSVLLSWDTD